MPVTRRVVACRGTDLPTAGSPARAAGSSPAGSPTSVLEPTRLRQPYPRFRVIVLDDDVNTFQHVVDCLVRYIPAMTPDHAWELAHRIDGAFLEMIFEDATNATNLQTAWMLINTALDGRAACYVAYYRPGNTLYLIPDNGDGNQAQSLPLAGSNTLSNSQCTIYSQSSTVTVSGNRLTLRLLVQFKSAFAGPKVIWNAVSTLNNAAISPWKAVGAWTATQ